MSIPIHRILLVEKDASSVICPTCQTPIPPGARVCLHCGNEIVPRSARLVPVHQRLGVSAFVLNKPVMTIGRSRNNDLHLQDPSVSGFHARVRIEEGKHFIEDMGSKHGLEINGKKVTSHLLTANDLIQLGVYQFRFAEAQTADSEPISLPPAGIGHLRLLLDVTRIINSSIALRDVLEHVMDAVIEVTGAERAFLMLTNKEGELEFKVARNLDPAGLESGKVAISYSTVDRVRSTGAPVVLVDTLEGDALPASRSIRALGLRSVMCVPLKVLDRLIGVIYVDSHKRVKEFSQTDLWLFESLGSHAALALEKSRLYEQLQLHSASLEDQVRQRTATLAQTNDELRQAYAELGQAQAQMVQAEKLAAIGRLAAGIAHEINSPLGVITSNLDVMYRAICRLEQRLKAAPGFDELDRQLGIHEQVEGFEDIQRNSQTASARIHNIIKALENFVGLDQAERKQINVNEALDTTLTLLQNRIGNRIRVVREYGALLPLTCSPSRINQAFMNVLMNAVQAIEGPGEVWIRSEQLADQIKITIEDTGRGMRQDQLAHVFEPIITQKEGRMGVGLGLAITRQFVQEHSGTIKLESEAGVGTKVILSLPLGRVSPQSP